MPSLRSSAALRLCVSPLSIAWDAPHKVGNRTARAQVTENNTSLIMKTLAQKSFLPFIAMVGFALGVMFMFTGC